MGRILAAAAVATIFLAGAANCDEVLRAGKVISVENTKGYVYIQARDDEGGEFWVVTTTCVIAQDATIEVLRAEHYEAVRSSNLKRDLSDLYSASLIRINGTEVEGFMAHGLPPGCLDLRE